MSSLAHMNSLESGISIVAAISLSSMLVHQSSCYIKPISTIMPLQWNKRMASLKSFAKPDKGRVGQHPSGALREDTKYTKSTSSALRL